MSSIFHKKKIVAEFEKIVIEMKKGVILTKRNNKCKPAYISHITYLINLLKEYETLHGTIYTKHINEEWFQEIIDFFTDKNFAQNTIATLIYNLINILKRLYNHKIIDFNPIDIRVNKEITTAVYNSIEELDEMLKLDLSQEPILRKVRDLFIIQSYSGLRLGDFKKIISNPYFYILIIDNEMYFKKTTSKTNYEVVIPISEISQKLLRANNFKFEEKIFNHYNKALKIIAQKAGINKPIIRSLTRKKVKTHTPYLKYQLMASHTARRNFATNAYLSGIPIPDIMKITGHKNINNFMRYVRCTAFEAIFQIFDHPFFDWTVENCKYLNPIKSTKKVYVQMPK